MDDRAGSSARASGLDVGMQFAGWVLGPGVVGFGVDYVYGTLPWVMLGGVVVGFVGWIVRVAKR